MKMGAMRFLGAVVVAMLMCFSSPALADRITFTGAVLGGANSGGEFFAKFTPGFGPTGVNTTIVTAGDGTFGLFCVEKSEHISLSGTYTAVLSGSATQAGRAYMGGQTPTERGGVLPTDFTDGNGLYDPISVKTAYVFERFYSQTWTNATILAATPADQANALQLAIWLYENEDTALSGTGAQNALAQLMINEANAYGGTGTGSAGNFGDVRVLNLYNLDGTLAQSQLVRATGSAEGVPLPGVAMGGLACFGTLGFGMIRRRRA